MIGYIDYVRCNIAAVCIVLFIFMSDRGRHILLDTETTEQLDELGVSL